jgi:O-methyltransferase
MDDVDTKRIEYKKQGYALIEYDDGPVHSYPYDAPWITDRLFSEIYNSVRNNTLIDRLRAYSLYLLTAQIKDVPGNVLEVGTWRGGTAGIFTQLLPEKTIYLADTFTGVVKSSDWEHYKDKAHDDTSEALVVDFLKNDIRAENFKILTGIFPEDTGKNVTNETFALVYLDVDVYQSTKDAFEFVWDKVAKNGIVVFDDYGMISACAGIKKFVDEIQDDSDKLFIQNSNGQAYIIKK